MDPAQWFASFRVLHEKARRNALDAQDRQRYLGMREEFARSLMKAQGQAVKDARPARQQLRVAQLYPIEVANLYSTMTRELSCEGFTVLVPGSLPVGDQVSWVLKMTRSAEPVQGTAAVTEASRATAGNFRVACTFGKLDEEALERIELAVFDSALSRVG